MPSEPFDPPSLPEISRSVVAAVPFDWKWSKNQMWLARAGGGRRLSPEARARRSALSHEIERSAQQARTSFVSAPLTVDISVAIPDHRGDAVNAIDLVLDAVEHAIGVDDRWYAVNLTWCTYGAPSMAVRVSQAKVYVEDMKICPTCRDIKPAGSFQGGYCKPCASANAKARRARARAELEKLPPVPGDGDGDRPPW